MKNSLLFCGPCVAMVLLILLPLALSTTTTTSNCTQHAIAADYHQCEAAAYRNDADRRNCIAKAARVLEATVGKFANMRYELIELHQEFNDEIAEEASAANEINKRRRGNETAAAAAESPPSSQRSAPPQEEAAPPMPIAAFGFFPKIDYNCMLKKVGLGDLKDVGAEVAAALKAKQWLKAAELIVKELAKSGKIVSGGAAGLALRLGSAVVSCIHF